MKLTDEEAIMWGAMMFIAGQNAEKGGGREMAANVTGEQVRKAKTIVAGEFEVFKHRAKSYRREVQ